MTTPSPLEVTQLLLAWSNGEAALEKLTPVVYAEPAGSSVRAGRALNEQDRIETPIVIMVNETPARRAMRIDPRWRR
jgi:hypothetical protein